MIGKRGFIDSMGDHTSSHVMFLTILLLFYIYTVRYLRTLVLRLLSTFVLGSSRFIKINK